MELTGVTIRTSQRYLPGERNYDNSMVETLEIDVPLPGGKAQYVIDLPSGVKDNLEAAARILGAK